MKKVTYANAGTFPLEMIIMFSPQYNPNKHKKIYKKTNAMFNIC